MRAPIERRKRIAGSVGCAIVLGGVGVAAASCDGSTDTPSDALYAGDATLVTLADGAKRVIAADGNFVDPPPPTCTDGTLNGDETDVDCGGSCTLSGCAIGKMCKVGTDCLSLSCKGTCLAPTFSDGVRNGTETGIDCGGSVGAPPCPDGEGCLTPMDCKSGVCGAESGNLGGCVPPTFTDGVKNGDETDVDCGGSPMAPKCADLRACALPADCESGVCSGAICQAPTGTDGVKNGDETDVDCGGTKTQARRCSAGEGCVNGPDCASGGCNYLQKCATHPSCTEHMGGDTCGLAGQNDDCCLSLPVGTGNTKLDKYSVTSGRMRAFVEGGTLGGQIKQYIQTHRPTWWNDDWTAYLPIGIDSKLSIDYTGVYQQLGPYHYGTPGGGNQGCFIKNTGARTYWLPPEANASLQDVQLYDKDTLDQKPLNCVNFYMAAAFCAWDGGRLPTLGEWQAAYGSAKYPWGASPAPQGYTQPWFTQTDAAQQGTLLNDPGATGPFSLATGWAYSYWFPNKMECVNFGQKDAYCDWSVFAPPPGRIPLNYGPRGHADLAAINFFWTSDFDNGKARWAQTGSWQTHQVPFPTNSFPLESKYLVTGIRCARD